VVLLQENLNNVNLKNASVYRDFDRRSHKGGFTQNPVYGYVSGLQQRHANVFLAQSFSKKMLQAFCTMSGMVRKQILFFTTI